MTKEEIEKKIEELKEAKFMNNMVDRWSSDNYAFDRKVTQEIADLKKQLEAL